MFVHRALVVHGAGAVAPTGGTHAAIGELPDGHARDLLVVEIDPQALAEHMAEYFDVMLKELSAYDATVDKFVGDAIVAFWGAPKPDDD